MAALISAAEQGDTVAQFNLGVMYYNGEGVPENHVEAIRWFRAAAEQGHEWAQLFLEGRCMGLEGVEDNNRARWFLWCRAAAEQGYAAAQSMLGLMYNYGEGVPENDVEAVRWFRYAAEQGHAPAQLNLGLMYANGEGVPENDVLAYAWVNLAGAQGMAEAQEVKDQLSRRMTSEQVARAQELSGIERLRTINQPPMR